METLEVRPHPIGRLCLDQQTTALELLLRTPLDEIEEMVDSLKKHRPARELREAMIERMARAPLAEFGTLKRIYITQFVEVYE